MSELLKVISADGDAGYMSKEEFVAKYCPIYFTGQKNLTHMNSSFAENRIENILYGGIENVSDVVDILAWKLGKINHRKSDNERMIRYSSDCECDDNGNLKSLTLYGEVCNIEEFAKYIVEKQGTLKKKLDSDPGGDQGAQCVLNTMKDNLDPKNKSVKNRIGTVCLITLLYFLSQGKYPIYDRFAKIAIDALCGSDLPVHYKPLPGKTEKGFDRVIEIYNKEYVSKLRIVFGDAYNCRQVDRALWVYGHTKAIREQSSQSCR